MSNIINPGNQPSKDWLTVQRTEKLKADKENLEELAKKNPRALLMACLCAYVRKTALFLASRPLAGQKSALANELELELSAFKKALVQLTIEDASRDPNYAQHLSQAWHQLFDSVNLVEFLERKKSDVLTQLKTLIATFERYPSDQQHSLGFYMTEFAGKEWLPFPFMEQLHRLYEDHLTYKKESQLSHWISAIDLILSNLMRK
ncbi:MAG TPA: hypothetical protein VMR37_03860 [Rhabdochlamydiaceae bacterium]|nr:hypothetical protein [Rhabdochlamydiaceae bacterium]